MPANLTPDYREAERQYRQARGPEEKLAALRRMLATIPKHKGTEKLQADIKQRISRLNEALQRQAHRKGFAVRVEREGAGQVVVVGPPNAGKSSLVRALTGVETEVADYPYTTRKPVPAMMPYRDVRVQLVDMPPVSSAHVEDWIPNLVRTCDAALLVADLGTDEVLEQVEDCLAALEARKIRLVGAVSEPDPWASIAEKRARLVAAKADAAGARERWDALAALYAERLPALAVSAATAQGLEALREEIFALLDRIRVYSKRPGHTAEREPFVLPRGSTVLDFAREVHGELAERLAYARIWGEGKFDGQRVQKDHVLGDGDIVELHAG